MTKTQYEQVVAKNLETNSTVTTIGQSFIRKMKYIKLFKDKVILDDVALDGNNFHEDPRVQYFLMCKSNLELALPILEKVVDKTLVL